MPPDEQSIPEGTDDLNPPLWSPVMRMSINLFLVLVVGAVAAAHGDEPRSAVVKKKAQEVGEALKKDDYAKVVDLTYPKVVEVIGGREKMIGALTDGMKQLKE